MFDKNEMNSIFLRLQGTSKKILLQGEIASLPRGERKVLRPHKRKGRDYPRKNLLWRIPPNNQRDRIDAPFRRQGGGEKKRTLAIFCAAAIWFLSGKKGQVSLQKGTGKRVFEQSRVVNC